MTDRYAAAGVRLDTADEAKRRIAALVRTTRTPLALGEIGAFGGMVRVPPGYERPVLVLSTDGVGTKVLVAARAGIHDTVGEDLVNHCVNDILVHGARPLAFLDYLATADLALDSNLQPEVTPVTGLEYMAHGLPFVAFDLEETRAMAESAARYVPPGDADSNFRMAREAMLDAVPLAKNGYKLSLAASLLRDAIRELASE